VLGTESYETRIRRSPKGKLRSCRLGSHWTNFRSTCRFVFLPQRNQRRTPRRYRA
jgi:hypothetical protein